MKKFDMHIHAVNTAADPEDLLHKMEEAGIYGGCVFSNKPKRANAMTGTDFEERLQEVLSWTKGYEGRLFPVLYIHPYEENIIENIHKAVESGIAAFKIICVDFYVYEEESLAVLREIAKTGKPVFFHSGILWNGGVASQYNRPLFWEALMEIEGLRFSMGHCSWPWIDECIALYGKFLNSLTQRNNTAEMFFDITPGTPEIYREELLTKLYTIGYDVGDNIMFGTDASAHEYSSNWAARWLKKDEEILNKLGVSKGYQKKLYHDNLLRFLGIKEEDISHELPVRDNVQCWSAVNGDASNVIQQWYKKLKFPKEYDKEFQEALAQIPISDAIITEKYDCNEKDGKRNLLSFLFLCQELEKQYKEKGISEEILFDTLQDIIYWTDIWSGLKGELYLGELEWLKRHLSMRLFKLGRLQFCMGQAEQDVPDKGIAKGDNVIEIHIPADGKLEKTQCEASIQMAREFFATFFPDFKYEYFTCHSWLLDRSLERFLSRESNILQFGQMFDAVSKETSDAILRYVFRWNTTRRTIDCSLCTSSFAQKIRKAALEGEEFYETLGVIPK